MTFLLSDGGRRPSIVEHFSMDNVGRYVMELPTYVTKVNSVRDTE